MIFVWVLTVGGVMGYLKSGSQKSLLAGGLSAALLYFVYTELPARPVFASSVGLGKSLLTSLSRYLHYWLKPVLRSSFTVSR